MQSFAGNGKRNITIGALENLNVAHCIMLLGICVVLVQSLFDYRTANTYSER